MSEPAQPTTAKPLALHMSISCEWYTPACFTEAASDVMGGIDVDPASCAIANETVKATQFYDKNSNGLNKLWHGRVWLNPPYNRGTETWIKILIEQHRIGIVREAILLVSAATDRGWFNLLWDHPICFTRKRISFYNETGPGSRTPDGSALVYFGPNEARFIEVFSKFGRIARAIDTPAPKPTNLELWNASA